MRAKSSLLLFRVAASYIRQISAPRFRRMHVGYVGYATLGGFVKSPVVEFVNGREIQ